jgi:hypothetical protein
MIPRQVNWQDTEVKSPISPRGRQVADATATVDPETDMRFAPYLQLTTSTSPLALIGLGVRKVSFLRVKVYSAGFYLDEAQCKALDQVSGWQVGLFFKTLKSSLTPTQDFTAQSLLSQTKESISGEILMDNLLSKPVACAVQIGKQHLAPTSWIFTDADDSARQEHGLRREQTLPLNGLDCRY